MALLAQARDFYSFRSPLEGEPKFAQQLSEGGMPCRQRKSLTPSNRTFSFPGRICQAARCRENGGTTRSVETEGAPIYRSFSDTQPVQNSRISHHAEKAYGTGIFRVFCPSFVLFHILFNGRPLCSKCAGVDVRFGPCQVRCVARRTGEFLLPSVEPWAGEHTMSDEIRRFLEQQEALRRMIDPLRLGDLQKHIDPLKSSYEQLGIKSATMDILRQEGGHRKMLSYIADITDATRSARDSLLQRKLFEGPVAEATRLGLFGSQSDIQKSITATIEAQRAYEGLFRLAGVSELSGIVHEVMERTKLARTVLGTEHALQTAMEAMRSPWLQIKAHLASATAFSEIVAIGRGIDCTPPFDHDFAALLRPSLGDWRDVLTPEPDALIDPVLRSGFYVEQGFDSDLTDFTPVAFDESLRIAGLRDAELAERVDAHEDCDERASRAFDLLRRFEVALRHFIVQAMQNAFGDDWMKRQLPQKMLETWIDKRDKALNAGYAEQPLIDYADFTDYKPIIERKDNWNKVFKPVFGRAEDVRESFQRLFPVRITTMHSRLITRDDELLLLVETKRVLRAIAPK
jgi:hypothetical protein